MSRVESSTLYLPSSSTQESPKIALIASEHSRFKLRPENFTMPSIEEFFKPFEELLTTAKSLLKPDYIVTMLSPAVLHPLAAERFSKSILQLLEQRLFLHLKSFSLPDSDLRGDRKILVLVTSTSSADLPWESSKGYLGTNWPLGIEPTIEDLAVPKPHSHEHDSTGFIRSIPTASNARTLGNPRPNVYNHHTEWTVPQNILASSELTPFILGSGRKLRHPGKLIICHTIVSYLAFSNLSIALQRTLTVREVARLQGFSDDFVFYGSKELQYLNVLNAVPPALTKSIAETIKRSIRNSATIRLTGIRPTGSRKRVRFNDPE